MQFIGVNKTELIQNVINTLKRGARSDETIENYVYAINRFLKYFQNKDVKKLKEKDIIEYMELNYLSKLCCANTYNMNLSAIKYFYSINFNKEFNPKLLPHAKLTKKLPTTLDKDLFKRLLSFENNIEHQCWLLLAYCSGLRVNEVATVKIEDINSKEHTLKILGKMKKERFTVLTDVTIKYLRLYYLKKYVNQYYAKKKKIGYLFEGNQNAEHISSGTIINYFTSLKAKYNLPENMSFHSLRHSFATNFIKNGGDVFVLKSMLGHASLNTTNIYVHIGRDFNNLAGINYGEL